MTNTDCKLPEWITYPERAIIGQIITDALARNYAVSVYDGEEWTINTSTHRPTIEQAIGTTDTTTLRFRALNKLDPTNGKPVVVGSVFLVHGNGADVISDHTDTPDMDRLLAQASALADAFSAAGH